jgi:predicted regulator of Ras-like GTPase activity (Roadblock/LC7/MglB family)
VTTPTHDLGFLLDDFARRTAPHVQHAIAVSSDGLLVAATKMLPRDRADQLSAMASGLTSLLVGGARCWDAGAVISNLVEMEAGFMLLMAVSSGASLLVMANRPCDLAMVSYEATELINRVGHAITPHARGDRLLPDEPTHFTR